MEGQGCNSHDPIYSMLVLQCSRLFLPLTPQLYLQGFYCDTTLFWTSPTGRLLVLSGRRDMSLPAHRHGNGDRHRRGLHHGVLRTPRARSLITPPVNRASRDYNIIYHPLQAGVPSNNGPSFDHFLNIVF